MQIWGFNDEFVVRFTIGYLIWFDSKGTELRKVENGFGFIPELNCFLVHCTNNSGLEYLELIKDDKSIARFESPNRIVYHQNHIYLWSKKNGISKYSVEGSEVILAWQLSNLPFTLKRLLGFIGDKTFVLDRNSKIYSIDLSKGEIEDEVRIENTFTNHLIREYYISDERFIVLLVKDVQGKREFSRDIGISTVNSKIIEQRLDTNQLTEELHFQPKNFPEIQNNNLFIIDNKRNLQVLAILKE
jgi:hypothetical protein